MNLTLSQTEIEEITGKRRWRAQAKVLAQMGISFRIRPDGFPVVSRSHFEGMMGETSSRHLNEVPDWSNI